MRLGAAAKRSLLGLAKAGVGMGLALAACSAFAAPSLEGVQLDALRTMARTAFAVLGLRHCARFDFRVAASGVWFLEANHKPDLTQASLFARSAALAGLTHPELIGLILSAARRAGAVRRQPGARLARRRTRLRLQ